MTDLRTRLEHRLQLAGLARIDASHIATEVLDLFSGTVDEFILSRHQELQSEGYTGNTIYERIIDELREWRFAAPELTPRQVRRRIYG